MDFYTNLTFKVQKGSGLRSLDPISKFWDTPNNCWTNRAIHFKFGTHIDDGPLLRPDHKATPKWAWPRSRDQISKFWDPPYNCWTNRAIHLKFGTHIDDGPLLRPDHKATPKWAWPRSRDQISKFWDPLITLERIEIPASNFAQTIKCPISGCGLGHVTEFRNCGTPS